MGKEQAQAPSHHPSHAPRRAHSRGRPRRGGAGSQWSSTTPDYFDSPSLLSSPLCHLVYISSLGTDRCCFPACEDVPCPPQWEPWQAVHRPPVPGESKAPEEKKICSIEHCTPSKITLKFFFYNRKTGSIYVYTSLENQL